MAEINANIVVEPIDLTIVQEDPGITITPEAISLTVLTASPTVPGGNVGDLQYNAGGFLEGIPTANYNLGDLSLGNIGNIKITGGNTGFYLQTDGSGNLTWAAGTGNITGNASSAGANNQIQLSDGTGNFKAGSGFSFDTSSNIFSAPGDANIAGNLKSINANLGNSVDANYFIGNLYGIANTANTVVNAAQPNITSVGTLTSLAINGTTSIQQAIEKIQSNNTGSTGTIDFNILDGAIYLKTANASANFTINITGNNVTTLDSLMSNNQSLTCTYINQNGAPGYIANVISIDGNTITPIYTSTYTNVPTVNGKDMYTFNIFKLGSNTFTVLGSRIGFE